MKHFDALLITYSDLLKQSRTVNCSGRGNRQHPRNWSGKAVEGMQTVRLIAKDD